MSLAACSSTTGNAPSSAVFSIPNPLPVFGALSPTTMTTGNGNTSVAVQGSNFLPTSVVYAGATPLATTYGSSTALTAIVPSSLLSSSSTLLITVVNPAPGGGTSIQHGSIVVAAGGAPTLTGSAFNITNLDSNYWDHGNAPGGGVEVDYPNVGTTDLIINAGGTNFVPGVTMYLNGTTALATTYVSSTLLHFVMPVSYFTGEVVYTMTAVVAGAGTSNPKSVRSTAF